MRDQLRASTQIADEQLDALVGELNAKIAVIGRVAALRPFECPGEVARDYDEMAEAIGRVISAHQRVHPAVREGVGFTTTELFRRFKVAENMAAALRKDATTGRPAVEGMYRNALARAAVRIIKKHCDGISEANLRRAVAAVLRDAGYRFPNTKKDSAKFDKFMQPIPSELTDKDAEQSAMEIEARIGDLPI